MRRISAGAGGAPDAAPAVDYERCAATVIDTMQASWDRWRIEGRMCEFERALNAGESVVLSGSELARAGLPYGGRGVRGSGCTCWTSSTRSTSTWAMCECAGAGAAWDRSPLTDR